MPFSLILLIAAIQGVTEFLPVSSSGHLVLIPVITANSYQGQTIDVAAHVGALVAVLIYLRHDTFNIAAAIFGHVNSAKQKDYRRLGLMIIVATIPVALVGYVVNYADWHWLTLVTTLVAGQYHFCRVFMGCRSVRWAVAWACRYALVNCNRHWTYADLH